MPEVTDLSSVGYVAAIRPDGRAIVTRLTGLANLYSPAATVTSGGAGAAGFSEGLPGAGLYRGRGSWLALAGGRPVAAELLQPTVDGVIDQAVMTSNRRDRARVVFSQDRRILASRLE